MSTKEKILQLLSKDSLVYSGLNNLFCFMENALDEKLEVIKKNFFDLVNNGDLFEIKKGKYITIPSHGYAKGRFLGNAKGFGFCQLGTVKGEHDIFIPGNKTCGAIDGDMVIVKIGFDGHEGSEGEVAYVYKSVPHLVGVVTKIGTTFFLEPDNQNIPFKIRLLPSNIKFNKNDRVVIDVRRNPKHLSGVVIEVLGHRDDIKSLELGIIREHELFETFPQNVIEESEKLPSSVLPQQKKGRLDLTHEQIFTIDGLDAKDLDDAISIKRTKDGYELGVHIADVGEYVPQGCAIDEEAFNRATSVYFPTSVLPMLPVKLSNGICSLNENVERLTLSCIMQVNKQGQVTSHKICESVIKSVGRLNYEQVYKVLSGKPADAKTENVKQSLYIMYELSQILQKNRANLGSIDFDISECEFVFDEQGMAIGVKKRERNDAHRLIEDFMVLANETVAKDFCERKIPFVYRVHEASRKQKVESVVDFIKGLGVRVPQIPENITPDYYQKLIKLTENKDYSEIVNKILLRSMQKARYSNQNLGHFGLALTYYCHFTSPIRRYPDLTIHRIIKEALHNNLTEERKEELNTFTFQSSEQSSIQERNADKAERDVDDLWKAFLMKDHIGEEFEGIITSVTDYGVYVELDNSVEGLIRIEDLPKDSYLFFEKQLKLKGQRFTFKIGDKIKILVQNANIFTRKVDFAYKNA